MIQEGTGRASCAREESGGVEVRQRGQAEGRLPGCDAWG